MLLSNWRRIKRIANQKHKPFVDKKNFVHFNSRNGFGFDPVEGYRHVIVGDAGTGKSYAMGVVATQFKNVIMLDPTAGGAFKKTLGELGVLDEWRVFRFDLKSKANDVLRFNIQTLGERVVNAVFYKTIKSPKERIQRNAFAKWLRNTPKEEKTWKNFKQMMKDNQLEGYLSDFELIFDKKDEGKDLEFVNNGKIVVEIENISYQSLAQGIFLSMLIDWRSKNRLDFFGKDFIVVGIDEGQDYAKMNTSLGNGMAEASLQARKFGIGLIISGSNFKGATTGFHPVLRQKGNQFSVFEARGSTKAFWNQGLDLMMDDWDLLGKYDFFHFNLAEKLPRKIVFVDDWFKKVREMKASDKAAVSVRQDGSDFKKLASKHRLKRNLRF